MAHLNIIQVCATRPSKDEYINDMDICEDHLYLSESDWGGEEITGNDKLRVLKSLKSQLRPFATVNVNRKTIRFRKQEIVKVKWLKEVNKIVRDFRDKVNEGACWTAEVSLRQNVSKLTSSDLFYNNYCCNLASVIADYLCGDLPQTLYIGAILDAHY